MRRALLLAASALLASAVITMTFVSADTVNCGAAKCQTCGSADECKALEKSGRCNGPITCGGPNEPCACVVSLKGTNKKSINQKKPSSKSQ
jgi:hypothetical protein